MTDERNVEGVLQRVLPSAPREQMESALDRVYARLQSDRGGTVPELVGLESDRRSPWVPVMTAAAAAVIVAAISFGFSDRVWQAWGNRGVYAVLETSDDALYRVTDGDNALIRAGERIGAQEIVRSNGGAGVVLALADGSRVEMRSQSELSLERADDGMRIRLRTGSIIVNAAKQPRGHLYVQTTDMTVAVVGTIFLVNAERDGSRVAVIEGEVRVHEGTTDTKLRPGEQVSTSRTTAARPVTEEIAWSRHADAHRAILDSFTKGMAQTAGTLAPVAPPGQSAAAGGQAASTEFEEASIRECDPDNLPPVPAGARGGGANSVLSTPGRFYALCITPATLIRTAYGFRPVNVEALLPNGPVLTNGQPPPRGGRAPLRGQFGVVGSLGVEDGLRVRGGPDWVHKERYTIEAIASGTPPPATMSGPMLRALFERRFKLKTHVETEQTRAFNLVVAPGGLKIKPVAPGACEMPPARPGVPLLNGMPQLAVRPPNVAAVRRAAKPPCGLAYGPNGPNWASIGGEAALGALAQMLRMRMPVGVGITDKTGVTDKFNWDLEFAVDGNAPGQGQAGSLWIESAADVPRAPTVFDALEQQLGLRLEPVQVPREYLVIDTIERPTPN